MPDINCTFRARYHLKNKLPCNQDSLRSALKRQLAPRDKHLAKQHIDMKTILSKVAYAILLLLTLCLGWSLVTNQSPKTGFFPEVNALSYFTGAMIGTWTMFLIVCIREKRGALTFGLSIIGTVFITCHLWRIHTDYFRSVADIMRRFVDLSADTLSVGLALGEAFVAVVIVHVCIGKIFLPRQVVPARRSLSQRFGLFVLGSGSIATVAVLFCINHQWFGADHAIASKLTKMIAGSESSERVMVNSSAANYEAPVMTQVTTDTTPTATPVVVTSKDGVEQEPVTPPQVTPEKPEDTQTEAVATLEAPTKFNELLIEQLKLFENEPLATGQISVSKIRIDKISKQRVLEVGYGITPEEIEELVLHDFLPQGAKLPSELTADEADTWLRTKTIPCYEMQVRGTIGKDVYASLNECQRFALISFCHNLGKTALSEVFQDPKNKLCVSGLESTCKTTTRYVHANHIARAGLLKRRFIEAGWLHSGILNTKSNLQTSSAGTGSKPTAKPTTKSASQIKPPFLPDGSVDKALVGQIKGFEKDIVVPVINTTPKS